MGVSPGPHSPADGGAVVLGIDPGTASTGFGVVERRGAVLASRGGGVISTKPNLPLEHRLAAISSFLQDLIAEHRPAALAIEEIFFGRNVRTAFAVGQARGAVLAAAGAEGVPCFAYTPQAVKLAVCGSGRAGKEQVQRMVAALLSLPEPPASDHAADALALAICHQNNLPLAAKEKNQPLAAKAARGSAGLRGRTSAQPRRIPNT